MSLEAILPSQRHVNSLREKAKVTGNDSIAAHLSNTIKYQRERVKFPLTPEFIFRARDVVAHISNGERRAIRKGMEERYEVLNEVREIVATWKIGGLEEIEEMILDTRM